MSISRRAFFRTAGGAAATLAAAATSGALLAKAIVPPADNHTTVDRNGHLAVTQRLAESTDGSIISDKDGIRFVERVAYPEPIITLKGDYDPEAMAAFKNDLIAAHGSALHLPIVAGGPETEQAFTFLGTMPTAVEWGCDADGKLFVRSVSYTSSMMPQPK